MRRPRLTPIGPSRRFERPYTAFIPRQRAGNGGPPPLLILHSRRLCGILFLASLALRLAILFGPLDGGPRPLYDERGYFEKARGFSEIYRHWSRGEDAPESAYALAYRRGVWPPLHAAVLGFSLWLFGTSLTVARATVAVLSAVTTAVTYGLTRKLIDSRAALGAALLHLVYPSFLAFSHFLWSESTYILVLLLALWSFAATLDATTTRSRLLRAAACGLCLGLATLTRAAGLPYLLAGPIVVAFAWRRLPRRWLAVLCFVLAAGAVIAPWERTLVRREGRLLWLSTTSGYNLLLGTTSEASGVVRQRIREEARRTQTHPDVAARRLARAAIARDPAAFARRTWTKFRLLWRMDDFILRHLLHARYPPVSSAAAWGWILVLATAYLGLVGLVLWGALVPDRPRAVIWLVVAAAIGTASPVLSVSNTRMALPILALLLPLAGRGLVHLRRVRRWPRWAAVVAAVVAVNLWSLCMPRPEWLGAWAPSSHYGTLVARLNALLGGRTLVSDCLDLRRDASIPPDLTLRLVLRGGYRFHASGAPEFAWSPRPGRRRLVLSAYAPASAEPLQLELHSANGASYAVLVRPVNRETWYRPRQSGIPGISVSWCGGGARD